MAASATDKFKKGEGNFSTTLSSGISTGAATIPLSSTSGLPTDTGVVISIFQDDGNGDPVAGTLDIKRGTVSGSNIINAANVEGTDQAHSAGDVVAMYFTETHWNEAIEGILESHTQTGTIDAQSVANFQDHIDVVDAKSIRDGNNNELVTFSQTSSAVNEFTIKNAATGNGPELQATGDDTNIDIELVPKGTGTVVVADATGIGSAWSSWAPSYTAISVGDGTVVAQYIQVGKTVHFLWQLTCGSTTSIASGQTISLPVTAASNYSGVRVNTIGTTAVYDASPAGIYGGWAFIDNSTANMTVRWNDGTAALNSAFPITEATGDYFTVSGTYEAA